MILKDVISKSPHPESVEKIISYIPTSVIDDLKKEKELEHFIFCIGISPFIAKECVKDPGIIKKLFVEKLYAITPTKGELFKITFSSVKELKEWHKLQTIRIAVRDLLLVGDIWRILRELSFLADVTIYHAIKLINPEKLQNISVIGLGKLGGEELNFFSDIDIMYLYEPHSNEDFEIYSEFFTNLTNLLSDESYGYRLYNVDLRLRPQGTNGPICLPLEAYRVYYENYGRAWEKMMLIKARYVVGNKILFDNFIEAIIPFVYKKYLDISYMEKIKNLRDQIVAESPSGLEDIKIMKGGIREIEFIVNCFQLIYGGKINWLRSGNTAITLSRLHASGILNSEDYSILFNAYAFYRKLENRIQMLYRNQNHRIPKDPTDLKRLALSMGFRSRNCVNELLEKIEEHKIRVNRIFEGLFANQKNKPSVFISDPSVLETVKYLNEEHENLGYIIYDEALNAVDSQMFIRNIAHVVKNLRFPKHSFIDILIEDASFRKMLNKVMGTSQYISKLILSKENMVDKIAQLLIESDFLDTKIKIKGVATSLLQYEKIEEINPLLRDIKNTVYFKVMSLDSLGLIPIEYIERKISNLAHLLVDIVYNKLSKFYKSDIVIVSFGKFATREMLYFSDIDMFFTGIPEKKEHEFVNKFIKAFSKAKLLEDDIFEIDTRIKPFGTLGSTIIEPELLEKYITQHIKAWEILAYSRATVKGKGEIRKQTESIISKVKSHKITKDDFFEILNTIRKGYMRNSYNIKLSVGGLIEIDLLLSYIKLIKEIPYLSNRIILRVIKDKSLTNKTVINELERCYIKLRSLEKNSKLLFYPPTNEIPNKGKKLSILARFMNMPEDKLIEDFISTKEKICNLVEEIALSL